MIRSFRLLIGDWIYAALRSWRFYGWSASLMGEPWGASVYGVSLIEICDGRGISSIRITLSYVIEGGFLDFGGISWGNLLLRPSNYFHRSGYWMVRCWSDVHQPLWGWRGVISGLFIFWIIPLGSCWEGCRNKFSLTSVGEGHYLTPSIWGRWKSGYNYFGYGALLVITRGRLRRLLWYSYSWLGVHQEPWIPPELYVVIIRALILWHAQITRFYGWGRFPCHCLTLVSCSGNHPYSCIWADYTSQ